MHAASDSSAAGNTNVIIVDLLSWSVHSLRVIRSRQEEFKLCRLQNQKQIVISLKLVKKMLNNQVRAAGCWQQCIVHNPNDGVCDQTPPIVAIQVNDGAEKAELNGCVYLGDS